MMKLIKKTLKVYSLKTGKEPFSEWLNGIKDKTTLTRIIRRLDFLELGHYGDYKALGGGIYELRLQFGSGYRIYFAEIDDIIIILLCGGDKSSQAKDIKLAKQYWREMESNNE